MYTAIFVSLFLLGWLICGLVPWLVRSVATRGHAGLGLLPLCLFAGVIAGVAAPVLGLDDGRGLALSFGFALAASAIMVAVRRFALASEPAQARPAGDLREDADLPEGL